MGWARTVVGAAIASMLLLAARPGADFSRYVAWARAFIFVDIDAIGTQTVSPLGVPLTQWAHGPGLVFAAGAAWLTRLVPLEVGALVVGWLVALGFWSLLATLVAEVARSDRTAVALALGVACIGTHAGYYSVAHSTESLAYLCVALLAYAATRQGEMGWRHALLIGTGLGGLLITRSYLTVYGLPAVLMLALQVRRRHRFGLLLATALPVVAAASETAVVQWWMTGSPLRSPYSFGNGSFQSLALTAPQFRAALFHPWHGLLVYHPWYLVGFGMLLWQGIRSSSQVLRCFYLVSGLAVLINLYIQASWYVWWLGTGTFGQRGMAAAAIPMTIAFAEFVHSARSHKKPLRLVCATTLACCAWTLPLLVRGPGNVVDFASLVDSQTAIVITRTSLVAVSAAIVGAGVLLLLLRRGWNAARWSDLAAMLVGSLSLAWLWSAARSPFSFQGAQLLGAGLTALLLIWTLTAALEWALLRGATRLGSEGWVAGTPLIAGAWAAVVLLGGTVPFARLALSVLPLTTGDERSARAFPYTNSFQVEEAVASYVEYTRVPGFEDQKQGLRAFLLEQGVPAGSLDR